jgi:hypothetical protein
MERPRFNRGRLSDSPALLHLRVFGTEDYTPAQRRVLLFPVGEAAIVTILKVPKTGGLPTTKVKIVRWLKQEGEFVKRGEAVVELETEKVNYELDSPTDGVLLKILTREGAEVPVGDPVCHIGQSEDMIPRH